MGIEIIHHQTDFLYMRIMLVNEHLYKVGPVNFGTLISHLGIALTCSWFKSDKNIGSTISLILGIISEWLPRLGWQRSTDFPKQVGRHFIHTHLRILRIIRFFIDI